MALCWGPGSCMDTWVSKARGSWPGYGGALGVWSTSRTPRSPRCDTYWSATRCSSASPSSWASWAGCSQVSWGTTSSSPSTGPPPTRHPSGGRCARTWRGRRRSTRPASTWTSLPTTPTTGGRGATCWMHSCPACPAQRTPSCADVRCPSGFSPVMSAGWHWCLACLPQFPVTSSETHHNSIDRAPQRASEELEVPCDGVKGGAGCWADGQHRPGSWRHLRSPCVLHCVCHQASCPGLLPQRQLMVVARGWSSWMSGLCMGGKLLDYPMCPHDEWWNRITLEDPCPLWGSNPGTHARHGVMHCPIHAPLTPRTPCGLTRAAVESARRQILAWPLLSHASRACGARRVASSTAPTAACAH
uniref:Uncharacterized protein n=1 Tax=Auxenochlorella protothecoides TaxID=3075 RepID=A0A1D2ABS0_AUXPR